MYIAEITATGIVKESKIFVPSSKSYIHRYLLSALFAEGESTIENVSFSNDISATLSCIEELGAEVWVSDDKTQIKVRGAKGRKNGASLYCGESASTLRFIIPIATLFADSIEYKGATSLFNRPLDPYFKIFDKNNMDYDFSLGEYLKLKGNFTDNTYVVDGSVSSQFVTGLLFTLPNMDFDSKIIIEGSLQSKPYVDITLEVLKNSGIDVANNNYQSFDIKGNQKFKAGNFFAQGDYSQVAFFLVAGCFAGGVECTNMEPCSLQGDRVIVDILRQMGADITATNRGFKVAKSNLKSIGTIDATDFPDIVPILSLACALAEGTTTIKGIERLRIKECDRAFATVDVLSKLGADICEKDGALVINGKKELTGGRVPSFNDHRMAMTASVASLVSKDAVIIEDAMSIKKSYPTFYEDFQSTGLVNISIKD